MALSPSQQLAEFLKGEAVNPNIIRYLQDSDLKSLR